MPEWLQIVVGTVLLLAPTLVAAGLVVCTHLLRAHRALAWIPAACAACGAIAGLIIMRTASDGLQGIGEVLLGFYLMSVGGIAAIICSTMIVVTSRASPARTGGNGT